MIPPQVKIGIGIFLLLLITGMASANYYQYNTIQKKNKEIAKMEVEIGSLKAANKAWDKSFKDLRKDYAQSQEDLLMLSNTIGELEAEYAAMVASLEKAKKRKSVVLAKPTLIERMSNRATKQVFTDLQCVTGDMVKCGGGK